MRHTITIQSRGTTTDSFGGTVPSWATVATVRAKAVPFRGRELMAAQAEQREANVRFYIRPMSGLDTTMRIVWNGVPHDVVSIVNFDGLRREMEILAKSGVNEG